MKAVFIDLKHNSESSLYTQLFEYLRDSIIDGSIKAGERLPSLRDLAKQLSVSITTCARAYDQLVLEGYVEVRPQSGYYVQALETDTSGTSPQNHTRYDRPDDLPHEEKEAQYRYDLESFDLNKWKKCFTWVMNDTPEALLTAQDPQGEPELRKEIADYLYSSRGVTADPGDIVISAGVQQLTGRLARMLRQIGIDCVNVEDPGYKPVRHIFRDHDFMINKIPVASDGLAIEKLPTNLATACYVSPSNQFPTGSVMPVSRRYRLLDWAAQNGSIIIEDDYDSELRYFGSPVPALKGIDRSGCVVYLGSFSSTLFPAIRISYMILPARLSRLYAASSGDYDQTCSKIEQLVLAEYMKNGFYSIGIRKLRKLYARKLDKVTKAFREYGGSVVTAEDTMSGINIRLTVRSSATAEDLCEEARGLGLQMTPMETGGKNQSAGVQHLIFYYNQIPLGEIDQAVKDICNIWNKR